MKPLMKFPNVVEGALGGKRALFTRTLSDQPAFEDALIKEDGVLYRQFDHNKSKVAAAIMKGISQVGIREGNVVLYLGASHGYTASHIADMVGASGFVMALDFAPMVVQNLVLLAQTRPNISPLLADVRFPSQYARSVMAADTLIMDVAQKDQVNIFVRHLNFLVPGGFGLLAIKARSIDVTKHPKDLFAQVRKQLDTQVLVVDYKELDPFEKDHAFYVCKKR